MNMLDSFVKVWFFIQKNNAPFLNSNFLPLLEKARSNFQLYGKTDEIEKFEEFIKSIEKKDLQKANETLKKLVPLVRNSIRRDLGIKS